MRPDKFGMENAANRGGYAKPEEGSIEEARQNFQRELDRAIHNGDFSLAKHALNELEGVRKKSV